MTQDKTPSDSEIEELARPFIRKVGGHWENDDAIPDNGSIEDFARAILAKWGSPVVATKVSIPTHTMEQEFQNHYRRGFEAGKKAGSPVVAGETLARLRHLYANLTNGGVRDTASAKRVAEGLLSPAIAALERATPQPTQAQAGAVDDDRERLFWEACQPHGKVGEVVYLTYKSKRDAAIAAKGGRHG